MLFVFDTTKNKLCAWRHSICPRPPASAHLQSIAYTPYACEAQRALRHEYSWSTSSNSILCSELNSQPKRPGDLHLWPFDHESGVRVTCDVDYLCANFGLSRPFCSRLRPDVGLRDRQTSDSIITKCPAY